MAIKTKTIRNVPQWATTYIAYNDDSGLTDEDKKLVDDFEQELLKQGLRLVCPVEGSENEFEPYPAFGLGSNTVDWTAEVLPKTYELEYRETLVVVVQVEAYSRREAISKANGMLNEGHYGWNSAGQRLHSCKEV